VLATSEGLKEWKVGKILGHKQKKRGMVFQIQWETKEVTWEKFETLTDVGVIQEAFNNYATLEIWTFCLSKLSQEKLKEWCTHEGIARCMFFFF
jgi:hypothetical protein